MKILTVMMVALLAFWFARDQSVNALSCEPLSAEFAQKGFDENPIVFVGTVTEKLPKDAYPKDQTAHYQVERVYKGEVTEQFAMDASTWGDPFEGQTYLMFVDSYDNPGFDGPGFCLNMYIDHIEFDIEALFGEGYEPLPYELLPAEAVTQEDGRFNKLSMTAGLTAIAIVVGGYFLWRNRSPKSKKETLFDVE